MREEFAEALGGLPCSACLPADLNASAKAETLIETGALLFRAAVLGEGGTLLGASAPGCCFPEDRSVAAADGCEDSPPVLFTQSLSPELLIAGRSHCCMPKIMAACTEEVLARDAGHGQTLWGTVSCAAA